MRPLRLIALIAMTASLAGAAMADSMRYYSFDAESDSARWRTGDVTLAIRKGLISRKIDILFRRKGADLPLNESDAPFDVSTLGPLLGGRDMEGARMYSIEARAGAKFMPIACEGKAEKAWLVVSNPKPYKPLTIWVVRWDTASAAPVLCVEMDYRFRGEWTMPPAANRSAQESPYYSQAAH